MEEDNNQLKTRNVTKKDIVVTILVLCFLLPLFWFVESGNKWAGIVVAIIPVIGFIYWLKIPKINRLHAEENLKNSKVGKTLNYFMWAGYILFGFVIVKIIIEVINSQ